MPGEYGEPARSRYLRWLARAALAVGICFAALWAFRDPIRGEPFMGDETDWISSGNYYTELVLKGDFRHEAWVANHLGIVGNFNQPLGKVLLGLGVRPAGQSGRVHSPQELQLLVSEAGREGRIRSDAARMLDNVFRMSQKRVRDVMVPRERVLAVPRTIREQDLLDLILEEGYTRLPVYDGGLDKVVGVLHTKDLLHLFAQKHVVVLADAIRPHDEISPDLSIADALRRFRRELARPAPGGEHTGSESAALPPDRGHVLGSTDSGRGASGSR